MESAAYRGNCPRRLTDAEQYLLSLSPTREVASVNRTEQLPKRKRKVQPHALIVAEDFHNLPVSVLSAVSRALGPRSRIDVLQCTIYPLYFLFVLTCSHLLAETSHARVKGIFIENGIVRLGVDLESGGGIFYFSQVAPERNLLNDFDKGRFIQQSYYGREDGTFWNKKPWRWNPVQGGNWQGKPAKVLAYSLKPEELYVKTMPKSWSSGDVHDARMEEWIDLQENVAHIHFKFTYFGGMNNPITDQEVPAIFMDYALDNFVLYTGSAPWTNGALTWRSPGSENESAQADENWAAFVDDNGWGLGVYFPGSSRLTTYRVIANGKMGPDGAACSYFAPIQKIAVTKGWTHEYDIYLVIGQVDEIRGVFSKIHEQIGQSVLNHCVQVP